MAFIFLFLSIFLSVPILHVNIKNFYVGVFSETFKARMLKLGIHMDNELLYCDSLLLFFPLLLLLYYLFIQFYPVFFVLVFRLLKICVAVFFATHLIVAFCIYQCIVKAEQQGYSQIL